MEPSQYAAPVSRSSTLFWGLVLTVIAAALLAFGGFGVFRLVQASAPNEVRIVVAVVILIGVALGSTGIRLLTGRQRQGGGLFSPWTLRIGGAFFVVVPLILVFVQHSLS